MQVPSLPSDTKKRTKKTSKKVPKKRQARTPVSSENDEVALSAYEQMVKRRRRENEAAMMEIMGDVSRNV